MKSLFRACILQSRVAARNWCRIDNPFCRVLAMKLRIDNIALIIFRSNSGSNNNNNNLPRKKKARGGELRKIRIEDNSSYKYYFNY